MEKDTRMSDFGLNLLLTAASTNRTVRAPLQTQEEIRSPLPSTINSNQRKRRPGTASGTERAKAKDDYTRAPEEHRHHFSHDSAPVSFVNVPMPQNIERHTKNISEIFYHDYISSLKALSTESSRPSQALSMDITTVACYNIHKWSERVSSVIRGMISPDTPGKKPSPEDSRVLSIVIQTIESLANIRALYQILFPSIQGDLGHISAQFTSDCPEDVIHSESNLKPSNSVSSASSEDSVLAGKSPRKESDHLKGGRCTQDRAAPDSSRTATLLFQKTKTLENPSPGLDRLPSTSGSRVSQSVSKGARLLEKSGEDNFISKKVPHARTHAKRNTLIISSQMQGICTNSGNQNSLIDPLPSQMGSEPQRQDSIANCRTETEDCSEKAPLHGTARGSIDYHGVRHEIAHPETQNKGVLQSDSPVSHPVSQMYSENALANTTSKRQRLIPSIGGNDITEIDNQAQKLKIRKPLPGLTKCTLRSWTGEPGMAFSPPLARPAFLQTTTHTKNTGKPNTNVDDSKLRVCTSDVTQENIDSSIRVDSSREHRSLIQEPYTTYGSVVAVTCLIADKVTQDSAPQNSIRSGETVPNMLASHSDCENSQSPRKTKCNTKGTIKRNSQQLERQERTEVWSNESEFEVSPSQEHNPPKAHGIDTSAQDAQERHRSSSTDRSHDEARLTEILPSSSQGHPDRIHSEPSTNRVQNALVCDKDMGNRMMSEPRQPPTVVSRLDESCIRAFSLGDVKLPPEWLEMAAQYMRQALVDPYPDVLRVILSSQNETFSKANTPKKKPINAFLAFSLYVRAKHIAKEETVDNRRLFRVLSQVWASANVTEKRKFEELGRVLTNVRNDETSNPSGSSTTYNLNTGSLFVDQTNPYCFVWAPPY